MKTLLFAFALTLTIGNIASASGGPEICQLKVNGQVLFQGTIEDDNGQGFYSAASQESQKTHSCIYAKVDRVPHSGRVYSNGALVSTDSGQKKSLTVDQADEAKRNAGGRCLTVSCIPFEFDAKPNYEQPIQIPTAPASSINNQGSNE